MTLSSGPNLGVLVNGALGESHYVELMRQWRAFDGLIQPSVISRVTDLPTSGMLDGDRYLVTGTGQLARYTTALATAGWEYYTPKSGWYVWSTADQKGYRYKGSPLAWAEETSSGSGSGMTNPMTALGDLIVGGDGGSPTRLAMGAAGKILAASAAGLAWIDAPSGGSATAEKYTAIAPSSGAVALSDAATSVWGISLTANVTGLTLPTGTAGVPLGIALIFTQDSTGGRTVTWPSNITWNGGSAPTILSTAGAKTIVSLLSVDGGTTWLGMPLTVSSSSSGGTSDITFQEVSASGSKLDLATANTVSTSPNIEAWLGGIDIYSFGYLPEGTRRLLLVTSAGNLVHNGTQLLLPGSSGIAMKVGDTAEFISLGGSVDSGSWRCLWMTHISAAPAA